MAVYWFPRAAETNCYTFGCLKQQKLIILQFWRPEAWNQGVNRAMLPVEVLGKDPVLASSGFWWFWVSLSLWLHVSYLCFHLHITFSMFSPILSISSPLIRTLVIGLRVHLDNPGWSNLEILSLAASVRSFSQIRSQSQVRDGHIFWGPPYNPLQALLRRLSIEFLSLL